MHSLTDGLFLGLLIFRHIDCACIVDHISTVRLMSTRTTHKKLKMTEKHGLSFWMAVTFLAGQMAGVGVLALPSAMVGTGKYL